jgi:transcriptional regulator with XRE-family HTH domain
VQRKSRRIIVAEPADPSAHQQSINAQQVEIYGERWADRFGRLLRAYDISQAKLAAVIGLSAPMISQLISGQRVKISNPAVYGRIMQLEEHLTRPGARPTDPAQRDQVLAAVSGSNPSLTTRSTEASGAPHPSTGTDGRQPAGDIRSVLAALARSADRTQLRTVSAAARQAGADELADLLAAAADLDLTQVAPAGAGDVNGR